jgi:hypothetical protein
MIHLPNRQRFKCNLCTKTYFKKGELKRHMASVHLGIVHECRLCNKNFKSNPGLLSHLRSFHNNQKSISSTKCNKNQQKLRNII